MGNKFLIEDKDNFHILCPICLKYIPYFKLSPPFIFFWCKCFSEDKTNNIYDKCQFKKITYLNYINIINKVNFSEIDSNDLSEISYCEQHKDQIEKYYGWHSKTLKCNLCKNPGEQKYIELDEYYIFLKNELIKDINLDIIQILETKQYLLCQIYQIIIKEININKIINLKIIKSLESLVNLIKLNQNEELIKSISDKIEKYIPIKEKVYDSIIPKIIKNKPILINIEQSLSETQIFENTIGNHLVHELLLFKSEEKDEKKNKLNYDYSLIAIISIGNLTRGDTRCSIYNFSLFPFQIKLKYKSQNNNHIFIKSNNLSKIEINKFMCIGNSEYNRSDSILMYSLNQSTPIIIIPINENPLLLKSLLTNSNDIPSFLFLSQDKNDVNNTGLTTNESGSKYIYFYNKKGDMIFKETLNNMLNGPQHFWDKPICLYIKNKNIIIICFKFVPYYSNKKSYLLFYNLNNRKLNLLPNEYYSILEIENYIISMCTNDDYLFTLNSEKIIQVWDCIKANCIKQINIIFDQDIKLNSLNLLNVNFCMNKLLIQENGKFRYYIKNEENNTFLEEITIKIDEEEKLSYSISNIDFEDNSFLFLRNKTFYIVQNC